jgi:hypothetical protein
MVRKKLSCKDLWFTSVVVALGEEVLPLGHFAMNLKLHPLNPKVKCHNGMTSP